jgi:peptide deformylase
MAVREIFLASDPRLRQKAKPIKNFGSELKALADDMLETMREANGVGLAAPQIGLLHRIFVAEVPEAFEEDPNHGKHFALVNPQLVKASREQVEGIEGCLSIPTWYGRVWRPQWIIVKARTPNGKPIRLKAEGYLARIFSHEMDHLDGILFTDHIENPEDLWQETGDEKDIELQAA